MVVIGMGLILTAASRIGARLGSCMSAACFGGAGRAANTRGHATGSGGARRRLPTSERPMDQMEARRLTHEDDQDPERV